MIEIPADVQTIVWDLDGTLLDSFGIYRDCLNEVLRARELPQATERILRNNYHGHIRDSITNVLKELGVPVGEAKVEETLQAFYALDNAFIEKPDDHLFADAVDLLKRAQAAGKRQIVVTNRPHGVDRGYGSPRNLIRDSRIGEFISAQDVLCGDDGEYRKPHREYFGDNLRALGRLVVVGDQFVDAEFAYNLGGEAILVRRADEIAHLKTLPSWQTYTQIVSSLHDVAVA